VGVEFIFNIAIYHTNQKINQNDKKRLQDWLEKRLGQKELLIIEQ